MTHTHQPMKLTYRLLRRLGHQRWLRFGIRDRIIRFFIDSDTTPDQPFAVPFYGLAYEGNLASFIDWSAYFYGAYSYQELDLIRDILNQQTDPVFIDVGANVGNHSLFAAIHSHRVFSFEPVPHLYDSLLQKQATNRLANLTAFNCALGEAEAISAFSLSTSGNQGTGRVVAANETASGKTITVTIKDGDTLLSEQKIPRITLIKIDVEGYEPFVLRGLLRTLSVYRPIVFFEWSFTSAEHANKQAITSFFPPDYQLFFFISHRPAFLFFEHEHYQLRPANDSMPEGNYIAMPVEALTDGRTARIRFVS